MEVGSEFSLVCEAAGYPQPIIQWSYNDEPVEDALLGVNYTVSDEGTLTVKGLSERGDLHFTCAARSEAGHTSVNYLVKAISKQIG